MAACRTLHQGNSLVVRMNANDMGGVNPLTWRERGFIENWEGEKLRVKMTEKS